MTESPTPAPRRRSQKERRETTTTLVIEAARRLIAEGGSHNVSIAKVGDEAGYSRGIVNHHFGTREELLRRVAIAAQGQFKLSDDNARGFARLQNRLSSYLDALAHPGPAYRAFLVMWAEAIGAEPTLRSIFIERDAWFRQEIVSDIQQGIADGTVRPGVDPDATALILVGLLRGVGLQLHLSETDPASLVPALQAATRDLLDRAIATVSSS